MSVPYFTRMGCSCSVFLARCQFSSCLVFVTACTTLQVESREQVSWPSNYPWIICLFFFLLLLLILTTIIVSKLEAYGIKDSTYNFFKSYLNIRTQKCVVNGSISESKSLAFGIPQGTILGPLLFILYINELPNCLENSEPQMYADDTHLTFAGNNVDIIEQKLNQDLISVSNWLVANKLTP